MENQFDVQNHLVEIQADDHDLLVNSDNENDDMLGYESEKKYGKPGGIKIKRYFDVDLTVRKLVMHRLGQLLRNFKMKLREKYILPNVNTPSKLNELPTKYSAIMKAEEWVEFVNYTTTDAYKEKSVRGKMARSKNVYHHKMGRGGYVFVKEKKIKNKEIEADEELSHVVFGKEKGGYARGVGIGVTYKRYFDLPQSRKETDERIELLQTQLDNKRSEHQQKRCFGQEIVHRDDKKDSSVVVRDKDAIIQKKSNGLVTSEKVMETMSVGKQMLHNQAIPNDCYKFSIDSSLVDAACIPDVENNGLKTVKDDVDGFFAWPKNQVVLDEEVTTNYDTKD
nr:hypothetical protein [Tanacetum cinerariifolium]